MTAAFDHLAASYDQRELGNPVLARMREKSLSALLAAFPPGSSLLEVGAGTGTEAAALMARGRHVVAVDPSQEMLNQLKAKMPGLETHRLAAAELSRLGGRFDGAYSSFGPLNLEPDLAAIATEFGRLVRPGGRLVLGVMNRWALGEIVVMLLSGRARSALRRLPGSTSWRGETVRYWTLRDLRLSFEPAGFDLEVAEAMPLFVPPPYARRSWAPLEWLDDRLASHRLWRGLGDHLLTTWRRIGAPDDRTRPPRG